MLDDSRPVVYIRVPGGSGEHRPIADQLITTSGLSVQARAYSTSGRREFSASCPTVFRTRPGQRIAVTVYSFRSGHAVPAPPSGEVRSGSEGPPDSLVAACEVGPVIVVEADGRRRIHGLCDPRQHREQLLLTTNTSRVAVFFVDVTQHRPTKQPQRSLTGSPHLLTNFIMKLEGTFTAQCKVDTHLETWKSQGN